MGLLPWPVNYFLRAVASETAAARGKETCGIFLRYTRLERCRNSMGLISSDLRKTWEK